MIKRSILIILTVITFNIKAQEVTKFPYPSLSPKGTISQTVGNTVITIEYERPSARKRQIFGTLVPWDKVWRTGAGHCTKIHFDRTVKVGGQTVEAGIYSLFTIPNPNEWIVILNSNTSLYGSFNYDPKEDVARFVAIPKASNRFYETLNFDIDIIPNNAKVFISWANIQVSFDIQTTTDMDTEGYIQTELLTKKNKDSDAYAGAAEYLFYQRENLSEALKLAETGIELNNNGWARGVKIRIFEHLKLYNNALQEINEYLQKVPSMNYSQEQKKSLLTQLKSDYERISNLMK
ncbi:DUF2911 domain-containing protein [Seonamhaeicola sp.]|uniref:DUF2911 domain-containing protein n=1 Tax=Seonamhaeicola sp. TaxID=1912245 RepID=UPI0026099FD6|nr:DUF2911 domain-containing protein [Seonamhaeicola sp.]